MAGFGHRPADILHSQAAHKPLTRCLSALSVIAVLSMRAFAAAIGFIRQSAVKSKAIGAQRKRNPEVSISSNSRAMCIHSGTETGFRFQR